MPDAGVEPTVPGATDRDELVVVAVPVSPDGAAVGHSWGKADFVAVAVVAAGQIADWRVHEVGWAQSHDAGTHGAHHARVVRFLQEHRVGIVVADHVGDGMRRTLWSMGLVLVTGASGDARSAARAAVGPSRGDE